MTRSYVQPFKKYGPWIVTSICTALAVVSIVLASVFVQKLYVPSYIATLENFSINVIECRITVLIYICFLFMEFLLCLFNFLAIHWNRQRANITYFVVFFCCPQLVAILGYSFLGVMAFMCLHPVNEGIVTAIFTIAAIWLPARFFAIIFFVKYYYIAKAEIEKVETVEKMDTNPVQRYRIRTLSGRIITVVSRDQIYVE